MGKYDTNQPLGYARCGVRRPFGRSTTGCGLGNGQAQNATCSRTCTCPRCSALRNQPNGAAQSTRSGCGCGESNRERVGNKSRCQNGACGELMNRLQKVDFSIQETVLYLDAYPDCCQARQYYHQLVDERRRLVAEYEETCGPLTSMGNVSQSSWDWTEAPWPWHPDFPGNGNQ